MILSSRDTCISAGHPMPENLPAVWRRFWFMGVLMKIYNADLTIVTLEKAFKENLLFYLDPDSIAIGTFVSDYNEVKRILPSSTP